MFERLDLVTGKSFVVINNKTHAKAKNSFQSNTLQSIMPEPCLVVSTSRLNLEDNNKIEASHTNSRFNLRSKGKKLAKKLCDFVSRTNNLTKQVAMPNQHEDETHSTKTSSTSDMCTIRSKAITLGSIIGTGSFSTVFSGTYNGQPISVKRQTNEPKLKEYILRELSILKQIDHPRLLRYIGSCVYDQMEKQEIWIVSEYLKGGDVSKLLKKLQLQQLKGFSNSKANLIPQLTWRQCVQIALDAAEALAYLHEMGIIHRDIKSANILVCIYPLTRYLSHSHLFF